MKYALNDKPSLLPLLMYGLQWFVVSIPSIVILGVIVSQIHYSDAIAQTLYMQKIFGIMGIALIIQVLWGTPFTSYHRTCFRSAHRCPGIRIGLRFRRVHGYSDRRNLSIPTRL